MLSLLALGGTLTEFPRREARAVDVGSIVRQFGSAGYHTAVASDFAGDIFRLVRETVLGGQSPILPLLRTRSARHVLPTLRAFHDTTDARALSADALQAIDDATGKPFFVVAFYSTAHFPYSAPAPHWSRFLDKGYRGPYRYGKSPAIFPGRVPALGDAVAVGRCVGDGAVRRARRRRRRAALRRDGCREGGGDGADEGVGLRPLMRAAAVARVRRAATGATHARPASEAVPPRLKQDHRAPRR